MKVPTTWPVCLRMPLPLSSWQGALITAGLATYVTVLIWLLRRLILHNRAWWTFFVSVVFVSPLSMAIVAWTVEHRPPWQLLDLDRQSWALMFGDIALSALLAWCAHAWKFMPLEVQAHYKHGRPSRPGHSWRPNWLLVALCFGLILAGLFRWNESGVYDLDRYMSYTKLFHDLVSYVVLATMVIFAAWPVLRRRLTKVPLWRDAGTKVLVVVLVVAWGLCVWHDLRHGLNPAFLHPLHPTVARFDPNSLDVLARNACLVPGR